MLDFKQLMSDEKINYERLLKTIARLSRLFSDNDVPFISYRAVENIFCRSFQAENLSRSDTAFDARLDKIGIGIKTFIINQTASYEKIAEFNDLSNKLNILKEGDLAKAVSNFRNERIDLAKRLYGIENSVYHIVARQQAKLLLYETNYDSININKLSKIKQTKSSVSFSDDKNSYRYNFSKSTLYREFILPENAYSIDIDIMDDPYSFLLSLQDELILQKDKTKKQLEYVILPLYGRGRLVHLKSGLNQWNASGRKRDAGELYIPIPKIIHDTYPNFFPGRNSSFNLKIPTGEVFSAKVCQDSGKALMTNPNKQLSDWLLRKVLQLEEGELATIEKLDDLGFDSVIIIKDVENDEYLIDIRKTGSYERFIETS